MNSETHMDGFYSQRGGILGQPAEMHPQRIALNSIIVQMAPTLEVVLGPDIALEIECEQDLPPILGVTAMVKGALVDLCATARLSMGARGGLLVKTELIEIESSRAGRMLETRVGLFACLRLQHAGNPVFDGDESAGGLARAYGMAQQHCGWLEVSWNEGEATSYDLYLPVASRGETPAHFDRSMDIPRGRETILLVDDELDLLSLTRDILQHYGYRIITAPNGVEALKVWSERQNEIDLLLTDMRMPEGINGYELAERLVGDKPVLKVIYVSGYSLESSAAPTLREGENFLTKPYTPPGLAHAVRRMLDLHEKAA